MSEEKSKTERLKDQLTELEREGEPIQKTLESFIDKSETRQDFEDYGFKVGSFGYSTLLTYRLTDGKMYQWIESKQGNYEFIGNYGYSK